MKFKLNDDGSIRLVGDNLVLFLALSAVRLRDASRGTVISLRGKETFKIAFEQSIDNDGGEPAEIDIPELAIQAARTLSEMEIMKPETKHGAVGAPCAVHHGLNIKVVGGQDTIEAYPCCHGTGILKVDQNVCQHYYSPNRPYCCDKCGGTRPPRRTGR